MAAERVQILKTGNMGFTTEVSGCWSCIHEIYESVINRIRTEFPHADDITMLGGHSSHSYQNGTNMYFVYDYNVVDCKPEEEIDKYHNPLNKSSAKKPFASAVRWCTTTVSVNIAFTGANWNTAARGRCWKG